MMTGIGRPVAWQRTGARAVPAELAPTAFYDAWFPRVYAYFARRTADTATAEDLTADAFERMVAALPRFRPTENPAATRVWVYRIAANVYKNSLRDEGRRRVRDAEWASGWEPVSGAARDESIALGQAVAALELEDQDILGLRYWDGLTAAEIGAVLGLSQREVYTALERCKRTLRRQLAPVMAPGAGGA